MPSPTKVEYPPGLSGIWYSRNDGSLTDQNMSLDLCYGCAIYSGGTAGSYHNLVMGTGAGNTGLFRQMIYNYDSAGTNYSMSRWVGYNHDATVKLDVNILNNTGNFTVAFEIFLQEAGGSIYATGLSGSLAAYSAIYFENADTNVYAWSTFGSGSGYRINMAVTGTKVGGRENTCIISSTAGGRYDVDGVGAPGSTERGFSAGYNNWNLYGNPITGSGHWMVGSSTAGAYIPWNKRTFFAITISN